ncbi:alpha-2-macroglobulin-like protein 1 [Plakobranchus ocellatus]|uniref:Alpha-2-macroglobulin-like protein 1 n=1 Tax=Plakobranchus ocellatus TaxID=259542 RepID=A0AAV3YLX0_9GAST|nr:alpha-2-macroglobulin-like protein 1 [Plakobranchus ocellatus]
MAPRVLICVWTLILTLGLCGAITDYGTLVTMPLLLWSNTTVWVCSIMYSTIPGFRNITVSFLKLNGVDKVTSVKDFIQTGRPRCTEILVPPPGRYKFLLTSGWLAKHDNVIVTVLNSNVTLIQTDKPIYKPGEKVWFRILTMTTSLKPRSNRVCMDPLRLHVSH